MRLQMIYLVLFEPGLVRCLVGDRPFTLTCPVDSGEVILHYSEQAIGRTTEVNDPAIQTIG